MTTYTPITDAQIDAGSPINETLLNQIRDNPIATMEGAAGAPRYYFAPISGAGTDIEIPLTDGFRSINIHFVAMGESPSNTTDIRLALSSDGGSSWGADESIHVTNSGDTAISVGGVIVDAETGNYTGHVTKTDQAGSSVEISGVVAGGGATANRIRIRARAGHFSFNGTKGSFVI